MDKFRAKRGNLKKSIILRSSSQVFFLVLFIYILWSTTYPLHGILLPDTFFKINPLIMIFTSISERIILPGIIFSVFMLILTLVFGRFFCGWVCPLGTMIDMCGRIRKKRIDISESKSRVLRSIKLYILGCIMVLSFLGLQIAWVFDPMVITARFISLNFIPLVTFGIDRTSVFIIKNLDFYMPIYDFYRMLKSSILGVHIYYFSHSGIILAFFLFICASTLITKRLWCRAVCPLGALYSIAARFSLLRRIVETCTNCLRCKSDCRMAAIRDDLSYIKGECILCMDCVYDCPTRETRFTWSSHVTKNEIIDVSRREFIFLMLSSFFLLGFKNRIGAMVKTGTGRLIRPPGALKEQGFLNRCIRCGNCMKVCPTNGLQPVILESGIGGIWTPRLVPEIGYCEYNCILCGNVCPTSAIPRLSLEEKKRVRLGLAEIDQSICIAWSGNKECIVCEEHCPVSDKAIKLIRHQAGSTVILRPYVDNKLCIGCGICQKKCPTRPVRAIKVSSRHSDRS